MSNKRMLKGCWGNISISKSEMLSALFLFIYLVYILSCKICQQPIFVVISKRNVTVKIFFLVWQHFAIDDI